MIVSISDFGGGGVGDFRGIGDAGRDGGLSSGFGDAGRTVGDVGRTDGAALDVDGVTGLDAEGACDFNGGGGIIPLL